jgi:hypothetical protein
MKQKFEFSTYAKMNDFIESLKDNYPDIQFIINRSKLSIIVNNTERYCITTSYPYYSDK